MVPYHTGRCELKSGITALVEYVFMTDKTLVNVININNLVHERSLTPKVWQEVYLILSLLLSSGSVGKSHVTVHLQTTTVVHRLLLFL